MMVSSIVSFVDSNSHYCYLGTITIKIDITIVAMTAFLLPIMHTSLPLCLVAMEISKSQTVPHSHSHRTAYCSFVATRTNSRITCCMPSSTCPSLTESSQF